MGKCKYCAEEAGLLSWQHAECKKILTSSIEKINTQINNFFNSSDFIVNLDKSIKYAVEHAFLTFEESRELLISGWEQAVDSFLEDGILDSSEENLLLSYKNKFNLTEQELDHNGSLTKTTKALVIRDLANGIISNRLDVSGNLPINFQKKEILIWVFTACDYLEDKIKKQYVGKSNGVSVRIAKGVYYWTVNGAQ